MANYAVLKAAINAVIKTNGNKEITGQVLKQTLMAIVDSLGENYQFAGVAVPSTNPGTPDQNIFYLAAQAGTYTNFGATVLPAGISMLEWKNNTWSSETFFTIDDAPTAGSDHLVKSSGVKTAIDNVAFSTNEKVKDVGIDSTPTSGSDNLIKSGAVFDAFKKNRGAYNVTANNSGATFASLSALFNSDNLSTLIPVDVRHGGMEICFVDSSDNKYVQFRYMESDASTAATFTNTANWQGIDDEPTAGSDNLVKSDGVYNVLKKSKNIISDVVLKNGYIERNGTLTYNATWYYGTFILNAGETIVVNGFVGDYPPLGIATNGTEIGDVVTPIQNNQYTATETTTIVISAGAKLNSATVIVGNNIFDNSDIEPTFESQNVVSSDGIAISENKIRVDGRLTQERQLYLNKQINPNIINTKLGGHSGDKIIVTLIDNNGIIASGESVTLQHGPAEAGIPYTVLYPNTPVEAILVNDVESFTIYCSNAWMEKSGTVSLKIEFKEVYAKETDFLALSDNVSILYAKEHLPYDRVLALDSSASKSYDTGIVLNAGDVVSITLHDPNNIITSDNIPLHYNDVTGPYKNISPDTPVIFEASKETRLLTWVSSSWLSQSGNISFHVEYKSFDNSVIDIILPSKAYAYVGGEFNIYNENVVFLADKDNHYVYWDINDISAYKVYADRLELLPTVEMIGIHTITCFVKEKYRSNTVAKKTMTLEIVANQSVSNKKVLFIGDSLTNAGYYAHFIEYLSNNGIQSIGTRESTVWSSFDPTRQVSVHHEGRGGWSAQDYTRTYSGYRTNYDNPFWDGSKFNFSYYMQEQGYTRPDAVFLNLGTNEIAALDKQIEALEIMIESIHQYDSTIPVFVHLITPPATQDGWAYTGHGDSILFDMNARNERKRYIEEFDNQIPNVFITPAYFNIDRYHDFPTVEEQLSQRNTETVVRQAETVHLKRFGYYKMGDVYYANIMKVLST